MKVFRLIYNPYHVRTTLAVQSMDGCWESVGDDSLLAPVFNMRLQKWLYPLLSVRQCRNKGVRPCPHADRHSDEARRFVVCGIHQRQVRNFDCVDLLWKG